MANMIKYKGQLYKRVDSGAPKALKYKGQMFRRVDSVTSQHLEKALHELKALHLKHFVIDAKIEGPLGDFAEGKQYIHAAIFPSEALQHGGFWRSQHRSKFPKIGHASYFIEKNGKVEAWHADNGIHKPEDMIKEAREVEALAETLLKKEIAHGESAKAIHDKVMKEVDNEFLKRMRSVKGFKRIARDHIDIDYAEISFIAECTIPHNDELDDDDRQPILKAFTRNVVSALRGFAKVKFDLDEYTRGDDGTSNSEPVAFSGKIEKMWLKEAKAKASK